MVFLMTPIKGKKKGGKEKNGRSYTTELVEQVCLRYWAPMKTFKGLYEKSGLT